VRVTSGVVVHPTNDRRIAVRLGACSGSSPEAVRVTSGVLMHRTSDRWIAVRLGACPRRSQVVRVARVPAAGWAWVQGP